MKIFQVEQPIEERIDTYLREHSDYSRSLIGKMIEDHCIFLNGKEVKASTKVHENDVIEMRRELEEELSLEPENIFLDIVFENENVIVINKPSGMVVHPGSGNKAHTMVNALMYHTQQLSDCNGDVRPGIVHRIDKDTSGLILVAKNNKTHELLADDFKYKRVKRTYIALVKGVLQHNHITIDAPIGRDSKDRKKMAVVATGKEAITHVHVLKRYSDYTLVECQLETGRTHQIRVHMAYIGYPIYNDPLYANKNASPFGQFLHSSKMEFVEPITKEQLHFEVPLPKEFQEFLDELD